MDNITDAIAPEVLQQPGVTRRIAVLHLIHTMAYGGVETVVLNWLRTLDRHKFTVHLVCFANPGHTEAPFVEAATRQGFQVSTIPWGRRKPLWKAARALVRLLRQHQVDILHTHGWYADFVGLLAAWLTPVKTITTAYVWSDLDWKRNVLQAIDQYVIRGFDQITAHCEATWQQTIARGIPAERVQTLICGFEGEPVQMSAEERGQCRRALGIADEHVLLANIARLYPEKAQDVLLRCFKHILQHCPQARLWIVGVGPLEAPLKALCTQLGLESTVDFRGFAQDLPTLLALVDIQVHPAIIEGVPLAICAGMAAGVPIVASAVGGLPEILDHGRNGVLVPPGDEAAFVRAVVQLIQHPEEAQRLSATARRFITHDYSLATAVSRVEQLYYEML